MVAVQLRRLDLLKDWQKEHEDESEDDELNEKREIIIGGIDFAKRVDSSAFWGGKIEDGVFKEIAYMRWPHVSYGHIANDVEKIQDRFTMELLGYDRSGVGDAVVELFSKEIPIEPVVSTQQTKLECIRIIRFLFDNNKLIVSDKSGIKREMLEQEQIISDAGNELYKHPPGKHDDLFWACAYACYVSVPYIVGIPPVAIEVTPDEYYEQDIDSIIENSMIPYTKQFAGYWWD